MIHWPRFSKALLGASALLLIATSAHAADAPTTAPKIAVVNFRKCVESSKRGKQQQASFEGMKTQMETLLQDKEKSLTEISNKLNDADYVDGLTPEAENELKHKYRTLSQEMAQAQQQFLQTLQQANLKIVQMLSEEVSKAAADIADAKGIDLILNEDAAFHFKPSLDISDQVIAKMDALHEQEAKRNPEAKQPAKVEVKK